MEFPQQFGKYTLLKRIATGGMAEIFRAKQRGLGGFEKEVAVKRLLPHHAKNAELVAMFLDEARIAAQLTHTNIAQIFDFGCEDNQYFIAMEYVRGVDLRTLCTQSIQNGNFLPLNHAVRIMADICGALEYAHNCKGSDGQPMGIVHRDISPTNILLNFEGGVKLVDFGIAKAEDKAITTQFGEIKGKYGYMSPEQAAGQEVDARTDLFAVGINLYEITLGRRLFAADSEADALKAVQACTIPTPRSIDPRYPEQLERIVMKALAKDPEERYANAGKIQMDLEEFLGQSGLRSTSGMLASFLRNLFKERLAQEEEENKRLAEMSQQTRPSYNSALKGTSLKTPALKIPSLSAGKAPALKLNAPPGLKAPALKPNATPGLKAPALKPLSTPGLAPKLPSKAEAANPPKPDAVKPEIAELPDEEPAEASAEQSLDEAGESISVLAVPEMTLPGTEGAAAAAAQEAAAAAAAQEAAAAAAAQEAAPEMIELDDEALDESQEIESPYQRHTPPSLPTVLQSHTELEAKNPTDVWSINAMKPSNVAPSTTKQQAWSVPTQSSSDWIDFDEISEKKTRSHAGLWALLILLAAGGALFFLLSGDKTQKDKADFYVPGYDTKPQVEASEPEALPQVAIQISSEPAGATIIWNGQLIAAQTPTTIQAFANKPGQLRLVKEGFLPVEQSLEIGSAPQTLHNIMTPGKPKTALFRVESEPTGATVFIDGIERGKTPLAVPNAPTGNFVHVRLEKSGFLPRNSNYMLREGDDRSINQRLLPLNEEAPKIRNAIVDIDAEPIGAEIHIRNDAGNFISQGKSNNISISVNALINQPLYVRASAPNRPQVFFVLDVRDVYNTIHLRMEEPKKYTGFFSIEGLKNVTVYVGPEEYGKTPLRKISVEAGTYPIVLVDEDSGKRFDSKITIEQDKHVKLKVVNDPKTGLSLR